MYNTMIQVVFVLGLLAGCSLQSNAHARVVPLIKPHFELTPLTPAPPDTRELDRIRKTEIFKMDGLTGNRADIPAMIATINEKGWSPSANEFTTMLALARLGATEAIPAIEKYCPNPNYYLEEWAAFAYAARARILAETENSPHAQVVRFFKEIGETPDQINIILSQQIQAAASMSSTSSSKSAY